MRRHFCVWLFCGRARVTKVAYHSSPYVRNRLFTAFHVTFHVKTCNVRKLQIADSNKILELEHIKWTSSQFSYSFNIKRVENPKKNPLRSSFMNPFARMVTGGWVHTSNGKSEITVQVHTSVHFWRISTQFWSLRARHTICICSIHYKSWIWISKN